jgi:hypothetical protein
MGIELDTYKKNRINELKKNFNSVVARLNALLGRNIRQVNNLRISKSQKQKLINTLTNQYNGNIKSLTDNLNINIQKVSSFQPKHITINGNKKALLIGINYIDTPNELNGCINDVNCIQERISQIGFNDITILTDYTSFKPTKTNILDTLTNLLANAQAGDYLFFAYSGHGNYILDRNGDETTGYDQTIVPLDFNMIIDDELKSIIQNKLKPNVTLFAMFDSCYSGSVLDLKYQYLDSLNYDNYTENNKQLETKGRVIMISGSTDKQTSIDAFINNKPNGAMTWSLLEAIKQKPNSSWRELIKSMRDNLKQKGFVQIPQLSSGNIEDIDRTYFI